MPDVAGHEISVFFLAFFHNDFIKHNIFRIGKFNVQRLRVNVNAVIVKFVQNIFYDLFRESKFRAQQNVAVFFKDLFVKNGNDKAVQYQFQDLTG